MKLTRFELYHISRIHFCLERLIEVLDLLGFFLVFRGVSHGIFCNELISLLDADSECRFVGLVELLEARSICRVVLHHLDEIFKGSKCLDVCHLLNLLLVDRRLDHFAIYFLSISLVTLQVGRDIQDSIEVDLEGDLHLRDTSWFQWQRSKPDFSEFSVLLALYRLSLKD